MHKVKIAETIAGTIKPLPIVSAMNKALNFASTPFNAKVGNLKTGGSSVVIHYSPTITISGSESKEEFAKLLRQHKDEVVSIMKREKERQERVKY